MAIVDGNYLIGTPEATGRPVVGVGLPAPEHVPSAFAFAFGCMMAATKNADIMPIVMMGQDPAQARNQMAATFMEKGCTHALFFDCDMLFPPDTLDRLLSHNLDIVAADYRKRAMPFSKIGWITDEQAKREDAERTRLGKTPNELPPGFLDPESGLVERNMLGLGAIMISRKAFEVAPRPWFARIYSDDTGPNKGVMTEDYWFCCRAREKGIKVWCDLDVTKHTGHLCTQPVPWLMQIVPSPPPGQVVAMNNRPRPRPHEPRTAPLSYRYG